jgi:signal transduction histidine kinase
VKYSAYKKLSERPIVGTAKEGNLDWYFNQNHRAFLDVRYSIEQLIDLNDRMMYKTSTDLKNRSNRSIMPGIIAAFSALIFTLIFNYLVNFLVVSPIIDITDRIKKFKNKKIPFDLKIETNDELMDLANSIQDLCQYVSAKDK